MRERERGRENRREGEKEGRERQTSDKQTDRQPHSFNVITNQLVDHYFKIRLFIDWVDSLTWS